MKMIFVALYILNHKIKIRQKSVITPQKLFLFKYCLMQCVISLICQNMNFFGKFNFKQEYAPEFEILTPPNNYSHKNMCDEGHIEVIYGPMFSGKSSELMRKVRRYQHAKKKCLVINYMHDNRYSNEQVMSTHDRQTMKALKTATLNDAKDKAMDYDVVAIDEGQFYQDIVQFCEDLANMGIIVMVAALDGTFQRKPFGNIINLLPVAEKVTKLTAVCVYCLNQASFTQRVIASEEIELIGGEQSYKPVCRKCFKGAKKISECRTQASETKVPQTNSAQELINPQNFEITQKIQ